MWEDILLLTYSRTNLLETEVVSTFADMCLPLCRFLQLVKFLVKAEEVKWRAFFDRRRLSDKPPVDDLTLWHSVGRAALRTWGTENSLHFLLRGEHNSLRPLWVPAPQGTRLGVHEHVHWSLITGTVGNVPIYVLDIR